MSLFYKAISYLKSSQRNAFLTGILFSLIILTSFLAYRAISYDKNQVLGEQEVSAGTWQAPLCVDGKSTCQQSPYNCSFTDLFSHELWDSCGEARPGDFMGEFIGLEKAIGSCENNKHVFTVRVNKKRDEQDITLHTRAKLCACDDPCGTKDANNWCACGDCTEQSQDEYMPAGTGGTIIKREVTLPENGCGSAQIDLYIDSLTVNNQLYNCPLRGWENDPAKNSFAWSVWFSGLTLDQCRQPSTPTPTPTQKHTPTPTQTPKPSITPTLTPTLTPSPSPTNTPGPSVTPTNTPTSSPTPTTTPKPEPAEFRVIKYHDKDGDGRRDLWENGLDWDFSYRIKKKGEGNWGAWQDLSTRATRVCTDLSRAWQGGCSQVVKLADGDMVRIKEQDKSGWEHTTSTEAELTLDAGARQAAEFGNHKITEKEEKAWFRVIKFEDKDKDGWKDSNEEGLEWDFEYKIDNGSWHEIKTKDDGYSDKVEVTPGQKATVREHARSDWQISTSQEQEWVAQKSYVHEFKFGNFRKEGDKVYLRIFKWEDKNADGHINSDEPGLTWEMQYSTNNGSTWTNYWTDNGWGNTLSFNDDQTLRVREKSQDAWHLTKLWYEGQDWGRTNEIEFRADQDGHTYELKYGNVRTPYPQPQVLGEADVVETPKTGPTDQWIYTIAGIGVLGIVLRLAVFLL